MSRRYRHVLPRRTLLRGVGGVCIALPFLDEMRATSVYAEAVPAPVRAFNVFFGLGLPTPLQDEAFDGPLAPLSPLRDKISILRGVDQVRVDEAGINAHFDGAAGAFTGTPPDGEAKAGGASLDQLIRRGAYPNGMPAGVLGSVLMGTYFRRSRVARYVHSWNPDGSPAALPQEEPTALFAALFGSVPGGGDEELTPEEEKRRRYRRSILDGVVAQYQHYTGDAGPLGAASRARLADHLDRVREYEQRVFGAGPSCTIPTPPDDSDIPHGAPADPGGDGIDITLEDLIDEWRLMCDLYALGVQCDVTRFGGVTFQAAGERIRLLGRYEYDGSLVYDFDDRGERGQGGSNGCSHEWWHEFNANAPNTQLRAHAHLMQREVAYFMQQLDDPEYADENGQTILDNALVTITTESGDGRHNNVNRELSGVMHAVSGANGRLKTGEVLDLGVEAIDLYNTIIRAHGIDNKLGPSGRPYNEVTSVLT
ncbi:MAG: DUF1552 domain-containing protein [Myxococcota bacterium]